MDIRPPRKQLTVPSRSAANQDLASRPKSALVEDTRTQPEPSSSQPSAPSVDSPWNRLVITSTLSRKMVLALLLCAAAVIALVAGTLAWYSYALTPRSSDGTQVRFMVQKGDTAQDIGENLYEHKLIRSKLAFSIYTKLSGTRAKLQAGGYVLSANQDIKSIVDHIVKGKTDEYSITIPPGLTLKELRDTFTGYGFSETEVTAAFQKTYQHPVLATRPADAGLEGYIYPETYRMGADQSLEALLERSFDELYKLLTEKHYLEEYTKRGLSIHQAVTLASIVQKEVSSPKDQKQVAQVFLKRMSIGMQLGSDVTFMYAAKQLGVEPSVDLDSPYNTRKYGGLPPGPIANMNPSALEAVAIPYAGDYLFFVAGDDGTTYYALTEEQHTANVAAHCTVLCR